MSSSVAAASAAAAVSTSAACDSNGRRLHPRERVPHNTGWVGSATQWRGLTALWHARVRCGTPPFVSQSDPDKEDWGWKGSPKSGAPADDRPPTGQHNQQCSVRCGVRCAPGEQYRKIGRVLEQQIHLRVRYVTIHPPAHRNRASMQSVVSQSVGQPNGVAGVMVGGAPSLARSGTRGWAR